MKMVDKKANSSSNNGPTIINTIHTNTKRNSNVNKFMYSPPCHDYTKKIEVRKW